MTRLQRPGTLLRRSVIAKAGYRFGDPGSNPFWPMVSIFNAKFRTDVVLLGAAWMGTMFLVARKFDAVTDPLTGTNADRTPTRWGSFMPGLLWRAVPRALSVTATAVPAPTPTPTFATPSFGGAAVSYLVSGA